MANGGDEYWSRSYKFALLSVLAAAVFLVVSFSTPYWLISEGERPVERFERLGLWEVCFLRFHDLNHRYDKEFNGCLWIFDEEYKFIIDFLEPAFFVAVQVFFTFGFTLMLAAIVILLVLQLCLAYDRTITALKLISGLFLASAVCCTIAVIVFGALGDSRHWMPDPDHNYLSWSFGLGVVGTFFEYVAALLFNIEARVQTRKRRERAQQVFTLDQAKA